jgi:cytidylate kinase
MKLADIVEALHDAMEERAAIDRKLDEYQDKYAEATDLIVHWTAKLQQYAAKNKAYVAKRKERQDGPTD